ncbi:unnamed protein product, partial [Ectocarpus sp. 12 AP-2014]
FGSPGCGHGAPQPGGGVDSPGEAHGGISTTGEGPHNLYEEAWREPPGHGWDSERSGISSREGVRWKILAASAVTADAKKKTGKKLALANCVNCNLALHIWHTFTAAGYGVEQFLQSSLLMAMMTRQGLFLASLFARGACFALYSGRDNALKHVYVYVVPYTVGTILPSEGNVSRSREARW